LRPRRRRKSRGARGRLANSADPDSLRVARHYAEARGVPGANLIALTDACDRNDHVARIHHDRSGKPLGGRGSVRAKWIEAIAHVGRSTAVGRKKRTCTALASHALVVCRAPACRSPIGHDPALYVRHRRPFTRARECRTTAGAVDSRC